MIKLCLLLPDSALYIPQSYRLALVSFGWNATKMVAPERRVVVPAVVGDCAMNATNVEVAIELAGTGDVVGVGTARRWVDSGPLRQQWTQGSLMDRWWRDEEADGA